MNKHQIIFIHGWGMNRGIWTKLINELSKSIEDDIICLDLPGYANSPAIAEEDNLDQIAESLLDQLDSQCEITLVGWSLGGLVATKMSALLGPRLKRLILIASTPCFTQHNHWTHAVSPSVFENFYHQLNDDFSKTIKRFIAITVMGSPNAKKDQKEIIQALQNSLTQRNEPSDNMFGLNLTTLKAGLDILLATDLIQEISKLSVPVYLLCGDRDTLVPIAAMQDIYNKRQSNHLFCEMQVIHHAGHAPFISHQNECVSYIEQVLNG